MESLDNYDIRPRAMSAYLAHNGWHFSKAMCEWAVSKMRDRNGSRIDLVSKEDVQRLCTENGVTLANVQGWDAVYVWAMCKADFYGSAVEDDRHLALYISDVLTDPDAPDGCTFARWLATMCRAGVRIDWEDVV